MSNETLIEALESPKCFCGSTKKMQQAFCGRCYYLFPRSQRSFLKEAVQYILDFPDRNHAFDGTYNAALDYLKSTMILKENSNASKS